MTVNVDFAMLLLNVTVIVATAGAVYGAIRSDLKNLALRIEEVNRIAQRAHERIDYHLTKS